MVGLLVVLIVLGAMAAMAVAAMSSLTTGGSGPAVVGFSTLSAPSPIGSSSPPATTSSFEALAKQVACRAAYQSVVTADEARFAQTGSYADTISQLVSGGYLAAVPSPSAGYTIGLAGTPAGDVTVNGAPGPGNCDRL
jgi:hypothetical protein